MGDYIIMRIQKINAYFKAWETKDCSELADIMTAKGFGVRTFLKKTFFKLDTLTEEIKTSNIIKYEIKHIENDNEVYHIKAIASTKKTDYDLELKITFVHDLISRVYEANETSDFKRIKCIVTYDGSTYGGYQKQPNQDTIQGTIENALHEITGDDITIHSSGRTDKGVHAYNQVFHFDTKSKINPETFYQLLNKYLPDSIQLKSSELVQNTFHSRYDVKTKEYVYKINVKEYRLIFRNYEWYPGEFDLDIFTKELEKIIGTHDFTAFTKTNDLISSERTIYEASALVVGDRVKVYIKGNGFLRYMIRNIIAALINISSGKADYTIDSLLESKDNSILKDIAPASGLFLNNVEY